MWSLPIPSVVVTALLLADGFVQGFTTSPFGLDANRKTLQFDVLGGSQQKGTTTAKALEAASIDDPEVKEMHPAVAGWPEKYGKNVVGGTFHTGPRVLHSTFAVEPATPEALETLDVLA